MNATCSRPTWNNPFLIGLGGAIGTLLYPLISGHGRADPLKAAFIGAFVGVAHWLAFRVLRARRAGA